MMAWVTMICLGVPVVPDEANRRKRVFPSVWIGTGA